MMKYQGCGFVILNHLGDVILAGIKQAHGFGDPIAEEVQACLLGLQCANDVGYINLVAEREPLSTCSRPPIFKMLLSVFLLGAFFLASFNFCSWSFIKRNGNRATHDLTHLQPYSFSRGVWDTDVPDAIIDRAFKDMYDFIDSNIG